MDPGRISALDKMIQNDNVYNTFKAKPALVSVILNLSIPRMIHIFRQ